MRILTLLFLFTHLLLQAQYPFNYGKSGQLYFMSAQERDSLGIEMILEHTESPYTGGMHETWDVTVMDFQPNMEYDFVMDWYINIDTAAWDTIEWDRSAYFINGSYINSDGTHITGSGGYGYGTLGETEYIQREDYVQSITAYYRYSTFDASHIHYGKEGPNKVLSYGGDTLDYFEMIEGDTTYRMLDSLAFFAETTYYHYDDQGLYINYSSFPDKHPSSYFYQNTTGRSPNHFTYYQLWVGEDKMASYVEDQLGMTPEKLFVEIYTYAVILFTYDEDRGQYFMSAFVSLEQGSSY